MKKPKALFRKGSTFKSEEGFNCTIETKTYVEGKGYLYTLKTDLDKEPYKRYYEDRIVKELNKVKNKNEN